MCSAVIRSAQPQLFLNGVRGTHCSTQTSKTMVCNMSIRMEQNPSYMTLIWLSLEMHHLD